MTQILDDASRNSMSKKEYDLRRDAVLLLGGPQDSMALLYDLLQDPR
jgi:hypothetical protein